MSRRSYSGGGNSSLVGKNTIDRPAKSLMNVLVEETNKSEPRETLRRSNGVKNGERVVRGPDWIKNRNEDDNGPGTVVEVVKDRYGSYARVEWDAGTSGLYRNGFKDKYDVKLLPLVLEAKPSVKQESGASSMRKSSIGSEFLECEQCGKKYKSKSALTYHEKTCTPVANESESEEEEPEPTNQSKAGNSSITGRSPAGSFVLSQGSQRKRHIDHEIEDTISPVVEKMRQSMKEHFVALNRKSSIGSAFLECEQCGKKFKSQTALIYHEKTCIPVANETESEEEEPEPTNQSKANNSSITSVSSPGSYVRPKLGQRRSQVEPHPETPPATKSRTTRHNLVDQEFDSSPELGEPMEVNHFMGDEEETFGKTIATLMRPVHPSHRAVLMAKMIELISRYTNQD